MTGLIVWADEIAPVDAVACAGAKMGRLSELHAVGVQVPIGFTITVDAYSHHCATSGLKDAIDEILDNLDDRATAAAIEDAAERIRTAFLKRPLDDELAEAITVAYGRLGERCGDPAVRTAVRSSATGEDSADASFAGIFDTYLGIAGVDAVIDAVRSCWASLFTARALDYRRRRGISHHAMPIAVGVLELVDAVASGVAFSMHPVSGKRDRVVVSPDHAEVGKEDRRILFYDVADKRTVSTFEAGVGRVIEVDMPEDMRRSQVLDDEQVLAVTDAVVSIEDHYGYPVDVEWVLDRNRVTGSPITIVQTRPVTTVAPHEPASTPTWDPTAAATKWAFGR